jgi:hypothetical protein
MRLANTPAWIVATVILFVAQCASANETTVELPLQKVIAIRGVVVYPNGEPVVGAQVAEVSSDWTTELRRTETDSTGHFNLTPIKGRKTYYLRITAKKPGVNSLLVPVQISRWHGKDSLRLQVSLA